MNTHASSLLILILVFNGCTDKSTPVSSSQETQISISSPVTDSIREVIYRYQISSIFSNVDEFSAIILANVNLDSTGSFVGYVDPTDELVNRIKIDKPTAIKYSQSHRGNQFYYFNDSTKAAVLFNVYPIQYSTSVGIRVEGGYYLGMLSAAGYNYYLHKSSGFWKVDSVHMKWIS